MEKYTKEFYLENRVKREYAEKVFFFSRNAKYYFPSGSSFKDLVSEINDLEKWSKERTISVNLSAIKFWIDFSEYEDINGCYLMIGWKDWETEEDFEKRMLELEKKF